MQLNSIKQIKTELKRLRKRQNTHKSDAKVTKGKMKLKTLLWKLLREQAPIRTSHRPKKKVKAEEDLVSTGKTKSTGRYS